MKAYLITIGDEILSGRTLDINSNFIAKELDNIGISAIRFSIVSDKNDTIKQELAKAFDSEADFIFTTGGLGPTKDDKTKQAIADFLSDVLILHQPSLEYITEIYCKNGRKMNELTRNQAMVPSRSEVIINRYGTAPVLWTKENNKILINLPGVPYETRAMMTEFIIPKIKREFNLSYIIRRSLTVVDFPESELALTLNDWENNLPDFISLSYLPSGARIELRLTVKGNNREELESSLLREINKLPAIIGKRLVSTQTTNIQDIIADYLKKNNLTFSVAESLTGGTISQKITSVSGSSAYYKGGITSYSVEAKETLLHIPHDVILQHTVVSEEVAKEMAKQSARLFNTDIAISTTGVAGPDSDDFNNPVGLAYIGLYFQKEIFVKKYFFPNLTRDEMITRISNKALEMLYFKIIENE
ncbi:MAG: CinA family nicotinamide mononucleotide deamidase-related protein [Flavobacteriaceae bacterium]|jgi:nicotinamide-nucleotide amidase|nr:CinA family nicotinamide mononucleotide deamidase-related protein [Flavobacteriaceae bacterium]